MSSAQPADHSKEKQSECLVCQHPCGSAHFGSTSCLACAAFFRRTVSLSITFTCKKSKQCPVFHELRMVCRGCRYNKCLEKGMEPRYVQKRRPPAHKANRKSSTKRHTSVITSIDNLVKQDNDDDVIDDDDVMTSSASNSPVSMQFAGDDHLSDMATPTSTVTLTPTMCQQQQHQASMAHDIYANNKVEAHDSLEMPRMITCSGTELLNHYVNELRLAMDRRCVMFTASPLRAISGESGLMPYSRETAQVHCMKSQLEGPRFDHLLAFEYCKSCPGFNMMNADEKVSFFRSTSMSFLILDIVWITTQTTQASDNVIIHTDGSVSSANDLSIGWHDEDGCQSSVKTQLFFEFIKRFHTALVLPFFEYKVDHVEYAALKAFCVWKMGYCDYTHRLRSMAKEHQTALLVGLDNYYENREDKAERLGNIILLMGTVFEIYQSIIETYQSIDIFQLFQIDEVSKSLLKC